MRLFEVEKVFAFEVVGERRMGALTDEERARLIPLTQVKLYMVFEVECLRRGRFRGLTAVHGLALA